MNDLKQQLSQLKAHQPDLAWKEQTKMQLLNDFDDHIDTKLPIYHPNYNKYAYFPAAFLCLLVLILVPTVSDSSLPGDPLYSVKRATENVKTELAPTSQKPKLKTEQAKKRVNELSTAMDRSEQRQLSALDELQQAVQKVADNNTPQNNDSLASINTQLSTLEEKATPLVKARIETIRQITPTPVQAIPDTSPSPSPTPDVNDKESTQTAKPQVTN